MTSSTDTAGHPDVAEISDLTEGLLPDSRTADVRRHLDDCELCADVHASLEEIRGLLGTAPGPTRMPADVAGRIDAALAAEALLHATAPDAVNAPAPVESAHVSRETCALSADRPSGHARSASTGPGRKERKKGSRRRTAVLGAAFAVAALGLGSVLITSLNDGKTSDEGQAAPSDTFSAGALEKQVSQLLGSATGGSRSPQDMGVATEPGNKQPFTKKLAFVPACVQKGIPTQGTVLVTKDGVYKGKDALLVVLPDPSDSNRVTAFIMDASCMKTAPTSTAKVLLKQSFARS
ncbi:anti-sigma factor family protein [Streptomyces sp. NRRL B-3229]|uniref:anti-sigma factor family protein n=1 Tax=Streptomyces sp. NRRL B-3229 TaxID=1463836 RepID=UPI0004C26325|nr:membrane protein [Streptomyces sp. NRRL B-3229]